MLSLELFLAFCDVNYDNIHFYEDNWLEGDVFCYNYMVEHYVLADCYIKSFRIDALGDICILFFDTSLKRTTFLIG